MAKIIAFVQQRLASFTCQGVGEAVTEVQLCGAVAPLPEIAICGAPKRHVIRSDVLNQDPLPRNQVVEPSLRNGITL